MGPLKTAITKEGQKYVDDRVIVAPREMTMNVAAALQAHLPQQQRRLPAPITVRHDRVRLNWIRPKKGANP